MNKKDMNLLLPVVTIILAISGYLVLTNILMPSIAENQAKITALDNDIVSANQKLDSISAANLSMTKLSDLVNNLLVAVPDNINSPDLITEIEAIANANQVSIPSLSPPTNIKTNSSSAGASTSGLSTNLTVVGSFQNINGFINSLETSIRFSKIKNLTLTSSDGGLTASINFDVYSRPAISNLSKVAK